MNENELKKIKEYALERHIPIIMDDTLEVIDKILKETKPSKILEIGTAVGCAFFYAFLKNCSPKSKRDKERS